MPFSDRIAPPLMHEFGDTNKHRSWSSEQFDYNQASQYFVDDSHFDATLHVPDLSHESTTQLHQYQHHPHQSADLSNMQWPIIISNDADVTSFPLAATSAPSTSTLRYVASEGSFHSVPHQFQPPSFSGQSQYSSNRSDGGTVWSSPDMATASAVYTPGSTYNENSTSYFEPAQFNTQVPNHDVSHRDPHSLSNMTQEHAFMGEETQPHIQYRLNAPPPQDYETGRYETGQYETAQFETAQYDTAQYDTAQFLDDRYIVSSLPFQPDHLHGFENEVPHLDSRHLAPVIRRRRAQSTRSTTSPYLPAKVLKRSSLHSRRSPSYHGESTPEAMERSSSAQSHRSFTCPLALYGCQSTFSSKNEWKRHTQTQHMRLGFWRCDQCPQGERKPNDFNRKDLFIQHVRRMHPLEMPLMAKPSPGKAHRTNHARKNDAEEQALATIAHRCYLRLRTPPQHCACLLCDTTFEGPNAWDERMEHLGRHFEAAKKDGAEPVDPMDWRHDEATEAWLLEEKIIHSRPDDQGLFLMDVRA